MNARPDLPIDRVVAVPTDPSTRRPGRIRAVLALGSLLGLGVFGSLAAFSDSSTVTAGFTAGTLDITVDGEQGNPTPYELEFTDADAMAPGDTVHSPLRVSNIGTVDAELSMAASVTPDGAVPNATDDLRITVAHTSGADCDGAVVAADAAPYVVDSPIAAATLTDLPLGGGDDIDLCLAVTLPATVTGTGGGASAVDLVFSALQATS